MKRLPAVLMTVVLIIFFSCQKNDPVNPRFPNQDGLNKETNWKANIETAQFKDGKFWQDGKWHFLKVGKPLTDFGSEEGCNKVKANLKKYKSLGYDALEINCYWHHFEKDGDGTIDVSLAPLKSLIKAIYDAGMYPCLTVETYSVGGGSMPEQFFSLHPEAIAIDETGAKVMDTEYGFNTAVVSIFNETYRESVHRYIRNLALGLGDELKKVLWFETTVEPQYMGARKISYCENARKEYEKWRKSNGITDKDSEMPTTFPVPDSFVKNDTWNRFRAEFLAKWVNEDAQAFKDVYKEVTGRDGYVAADYLDADEATMYLRDGNPQVFLNNLTVPDIIQINWTLDFATMQFNENAYERVRNAMKVNGRTDWVISEHMTWQGEFAQLLGQNKAEQHIRKIFQHSTRCCMDFVNLLPSDTDGFCLYTKNWATKMPIIDNKWNNWMDYAWSLEK